jgi:hypothetical protein
LVLFAPSRTPSGATRPETEGTGVDEVTTSVAIFNLVFLAVLLGGMLGAWMARKR